MSQLSDLTGAGLATFMHEGRTYTLSPLELVDLGELEMWLQAVPFEIARHKIKALGDAANDAMISKIMEAAEAESRGLSLSTNAKAAKVPVVGYTVMMLWLSLKKTMPEITMNEASKLLTRENFKIIQSQLDKLSGLGGDGSTTNKKKAPAKMNGKGRLHRENRSTGKKSS